MHYTLKSSDDKEKAEGTNGAGALQQKLLESRSIVISGEMNQELAQKVITQMILLQSVSNDPIKLYINSRAAMWKRVIPSTTSLSLSVRKYTLLAPAGWQAPGSPSSWQRKRAPLLAAKYPLYDPPAAGRRARSGNGY